MTYHPKSDFIRIMMERGFLADCTDYQGLDDALMKGAVPAYIGYDATAKIPSCGASDEYHGAALVAEMRRQTDHPDGRRQPPKWAIRRSGRMNAPCSTTPPSTPTFLACKQVFEKYLSVWRR